MMYVHASHLVTRWGEHGHINKSLLLQIDLQMSLYTTMVAERRVHAIWTDYFLTQPMRALGLMDFGPS